MTIIAALLAFYDPERRWLLLKCAALMLESEIWKFRMSFSTNIKSSSKSREDDLRRFIEIVGEMVARNHSASRFMARFHLFERPTAWQQECCRHGQYGKQKT